MSDVCPDCGRPDGRLNGPLPPEGCLDQGGDSCARLTADRLRSQLAAVTAERDAAMACIEDADLLRRHLSDSNDGSDEVCWALEHYELNRAALAKLTERR